MDGKDNQKRKWPSLRQTKPSDTGKEGRRKTVEFLGVEIPKTKKLDTIDSVVSQVETQRKLSNYKRKRSKSRKSGDESEVEEMPNPELTWKSREELELDSERASPAPDPKLKNSWDWNSEDDERLAHEDFIQRKSRASLASGSSTSSKHKKHRRKKSRSKSKTKRIPGDIFGFISKLKSSKQDIFKPDPTMNLESESELMEEDEEEKDMTWLLQVSSIEPDDYAVSGTQDSAISSSRFFWFFLWIGGRMPFHFEISSDTENSQITCHIKKKSFTYWPFVITSLILLILTVISIINLILIIDNEETQGNSHNRIEKLFYERNKVNTFIFLTSLLMASISSINVLIYGDSIAKYVTLWEKTIDDFNFKLSSGIKTVIIIYITWSTSLFLLQVLVFSLTHSDPNPNLLIEEIYLIMLLVFRSFAPNILIDVKEAAKPGNTLEIQSSHTLKHYGVFVLTLKAYILYCSWNFLVMIVIFSIGITNIATEWNFRLRIVLRQINIKRNELFLRRVKLTQGYRKMFEFHRKIVFLVQENSKVFCTILITFYLTVAIVLVAELRELAMYAVGQKTLNESTKANDLENEPDNFMYLCFQFSQTIGIFLFVSLLIAQTGIVTMRGLSHVTRHNYMNITTGHRRNFFMSLSMSFNSRKPFLLGAGKIFSIDRPFILGFLAFFLYIFSILIQIQHPRNLALPIIIESAPGQFSKAIKQATTHDVGTINAANEAMIWNFKNLTNRTGNVTPPPTTTTTTPTTTTTTTPTTTTTTATTTTTTITTTTTTTTTTSPPATVDDCKVPGTSTAKKVAVVIYAYNNNIRIPYVVCCYNLNSCNLLPSQFVSQCKINFYSDAVFPFKLQNYRQDFQDCMLRNQAGQCYPMTGCLCGAQRSIVFNQGGSLVCYPP